MLDKIGAEITGFSKMFPVEASLANFTIFLSQGQRNIESFYPQIDQMDFYRFVHIHVYIQTVFIRVWKRKSVTLLGQEFGSHKINCLFMLRVGFRAAILVCSGFYEY